MAAAEKALWFIESHYSEDLSLARIAEMAGVSPFHLTRLFQSMTGCSVVRYLRARRMTEAARRLADGAPDIFDVALASGCDSHEAFTRAFGEQFGLGPASVRERGSAPRDPSRHPHGRVRDRLIRSIRATAARATTSRIESIGSETPLVQNDGHGFLDCRSRQCLASMSENGEFPPRRGASLQA